MDVILIKDVAKVGKQNLVYSGTDGYCRNFLLKKKLAVLATPQNLKIFASREKLRKRNKAILQEKVDKLALKLNAREITFLLEMNARIRKVNKAITHTDIKKQIINIISEITRYDFGEIKFKFLEKTYTRKQKSKIILSFNYGVKAEINIEIQ